MVRAIGGVIMPEFPVGERVYHTKLGFGTVMPVEANPELKAEDVTKYITVRFDKELPPRCGRDGYYSFNTNGTHFKHDAEELRGTLSLLSDLIPVPEDWYRQLVE